MSSLEKKKTLFLIALATEGISAAEWARRHGVSRAAVSLSLSGKMTSRPLSEKINRYTHRRLKRAGIKVGALA